MVMLPGAAAVMISKHAEVTTAVKPKMYYTEMLTRWQKC